MNYCDHALWQSLQTFPFGNDTNSFSARLARENRWSAEFTGRVIDEYRKFLFLCGVSGENLAPSKSVDEAWHLHLIYTRSYWKDFCGAVLGRELHHNPGEPQRGPTIRHCFYTAHGLKRKPLPISGRRGAL